MAWQLWTGHQLRLGARLYSDIIETNPPLWFWEAIPLDWAGALLHIPSHALLVIAIGCAASLSIWSTGRLVPDLAPPWRAALLVYAALTLLLMPLIDTGQREQLVLICALPYVTLAAVRREGRAVNAKFAVMIGVGACFGLALKHYFLIAPVIIELWLLVGKRRDYRPFRPETAAVAAVAVLYAIAVVAIAPDFLTRMVPLNRIAYAGIGASKLADMFGPIQFFWLLVSAPLLVHPGTLRRSPLAAAAALAALGFGIGWFIQFKGFPYHSIPVSGFLMIALACFLVENRHGLSFLMRATAAALLLLPLGFTAWYGPFRDDFAPIVQPMLKDVGPHESVAFISDLPVFAWPLSLYRDAPYPSRHYAMWILRAVATDGGRTPALTQIGRQVAEDTAQDYRCAQPVRIIFSRKPINGFQIEDWLLANRSFANVMEHYRRTGTYRIFDIYELREHFEPPPASACRRNF
ncbi:MAG: hypothetical protein ABIO80_01125 [Sphingomicrobium sp.]